MIDRDPEPSRTLLSIQALRWRALAEIRQQPGYSGVLDIGINHVTDGPMMERRPIGGASHGRGLLRGSRTVDLNQSSTLRVCKQFDPIMLSQLVDHGHIGRCPRHCRTTGGQTSK